MEDLLKEQQKTNELLQKLIIQNKDPNELLTVEQIHKEFDIRNKHGAKDVSRPRIASTTIYNTI